MEQSPMMAPAGLDRAMKPFALPLGLASPMWMAYGAAAGMGATWWWMSRMSRFVAPSFPESLTPKWSTPPVAVAEPVVAAMEAPLAAIEETVMAVPAPVESAPAPVAPEVSIDQPDELTLLRGVGPRVADALVARGITTFAQLAAWTDDDMAAFDAELKLLGRSKRYDFIGQARDLASEA